MNDTQRLNFIAELVKLPTASFHFHDDDTAAEIAGVPVGYSIRIDESCLPALQVTAPTWRKAIDRAKRAMDKQDKE